MIADIELDATKLSPTEADERWIAAGRYLREQRPDSYRKVFALAEGIVAELEHDGIAPDEQARAAMLAGEAAPADTAERVAIRAAVMRAVDDIASEPRDVVRHRHAETLLRAVDWAAVSPATIRAVFALVLHAAPIEALRLASPLAAEPTAPIVPDLGIAEVARVLVEINAREANGEGIAAEPRKGGN